MPEQMPPAHLDSLDIFTPGNASFPLSDPAAESGFRLELSQGSRQRSEYTATVFDAGVHERAIFAGGHPGLALGNVWPKDAEGLPYVPAVDETEAVQMSAPLVRRLGAMGWSRTSIDERVRVQGRSDNTLGDILWSIRTGALEADRYHDAATARGILVVAGPEHAARILPTLATALDMDPARISRAPIRDPFGVPATEFLPGQLAIMARLQARVALVVHRVATQGLRRGNVDALAAAEERFTEIVQELRRGKPATAAKVVMSLL